MSPSLEEVRRRIEPADPTAAEAAGRELDGKTKPRGSLGRLEALVRRIAGMRAQARPAIPASPVIVVMGADHGVAAAGVSAYPQAVTRQMLLNFDAGGAAINVLARQVGARLVVVDMGTVEPLPPSSGVRVERIGPGTRNLLEEPAMSRAEAERAVERGLALGRELIRDGADLIAVGEMGIGNTTASSALVAHFTGADPAAVTGRGTGIDDAGHARKVAVVRDALAARAADGADPLDALAKLGGFEIAGLAGVLLAAAEARVPALLDGFITSAAALAAVRFAPSSAAYLIASHRSVEPGHAVALSALGLEPLLELDLRLGEGTGAALAVPIVQAAVRILHEMASFAAAGVSDSGA